MNIFQPQRIYLHLAIIALVLLSLLTYSYSYHADMMRTAVNLIEAAERIKGEVTTAHIRLEDIISGHRHKDEWLM